MLKWPLRQWHLFCLALSFFSRIPVPASTPYSPELLNQSSRYLSLVGLLLGALQALVLLATAQLLPFSIAVLLALMAGLVLTGAFHEDGLADTADGLGGGLSLERKLEIMKDSRVGTYGLVALLLAFAFGVVDLDRVEAGEGFDQARLALGGQRHRAFQPQYWRSRSITPPELVTGICAPVGMAWYCTTWREPP